MATTTTNYKLKKPEGTDVYDIGDHNYNSDRIDAGLDDIRVKHNRAALYLRGAICGLMTKKLEVSAFGEVANNDGTDAGVLAAAHQKLLLRGNVIEAVLHFESITEVPNNHRKVMFTINPDYCPELVVSGAVGGFVKVKINGSTKYFPVSGYINSAGGNGMVVVIFPPEAAGKTGELYIQMNYTIAPDPEIWEDWPYPGCDLTELFVYLPS